MNGGAVAGSRPAGPLPREVPMTALPSLLLTWPSNLPEREGKVRILPSACPGPASPSPGYSSRFNGSGFPAQVARPGHLVPGARSQLGTFVCCGHLAARPDRHTALCSDVFFLKNISHLCFQCTHVFSEFRVSPDKWEARNWILCPRAPPAEDDSGQPYS